MMKRRISLALSLLMLLTLIPAALAAETAPTLSLIHISEPTRQF